jgi:hypothetical protein
MNQIHINHEVTHVFGLWKISKLSVCVNKHFMLISSYLNLYQIVIKINVYFKRGA